MSELFDKLAKLMEVIQYWFSVLVQRLGWMEDWAENKVTICVDASPSDAE